MKTILPVTCDMDNNEWKQILFLKTPLKIQCYNTYKLWVFLKNKALSNQKYSKITDL